MFELLGNVVNESALSAEEDTFMENYSTGWECKYNDAEDALLYTAMESEQNFNAIMQATMVQEASYLMEHGTEMVYEAADFKAFFGKIKAVVLKAWEKVKAIFKKVFDTIAGWVSSDKKYIEKNADAMKKANGTKIDYEGYDVKHYNLIQEMVDCVSDYSYEELIVSKRAGKTSDENIQKAILKSIAKCDTKEKYLNYADKQLGLDKKTTIKTYNADSCISEIKEAKKSKEAAKKDYDMAKKLFASLSSQCDLAVRSLSNMKGSDGKAAYTDKQTNGASSAAGEFSKAMNFFTTLAHAALNKEIKAISVGHAQAKAMTTKALAAASTGKKDSTNESFAFNIDGVELI